MNRLTIVSLTAAAVLGSAGGVGLAVANGGDDDATGRDGSSTSTSPSNSDATKTSESTGTKATDKPPTKPAEDAGLFYYADGAIHDGDKNVAVPAGIGEGEVVALQRVKGGWLFVEGTEDGSGDPVRVGTFIATDGDSWRIGEWRGLWDLTVERDRVVYGNGVSWKAAEFSTRKATPLDVIDGPGEELEFMSGHETLPGIAITEKGVLTGWATEGENLIVQTETDHWSHELLNLPRDIDVPLTSLNGKFGSGNVPNPKYAADSPVGSCLTGGRIDAVEQWWEVCERRSASAAPYSLDGTQLLVGIAVGDGPAPDELEIFDSATGKVVHKLDPSKGGNGTYLLGSEWGDDGSVITLTGFDDTPTLSINRCSVTKGTCTPELDVEGSVVLGSST